MCPGMRVCVSMCLSMCVCKHVPQHACVFVCMCPSMRVEVRGQLSGGSPSAPAPFRPQGRALVLDLGSAFA